MGGLSIQACFTGCWERGGPAGPLPDRRRGVFPHFPQETRGSVAVRVALGETQLVQEVRRFLIDNGVRLDSFSQVGARPGPATQATGELGRGSSRS